MTKYSADDIINQHFERSFRGYNPEQVQEFLDSLGQEWRRMQQELQRLQVESEEQARELRDWRRRERDLLDALATAREMADEVKLKAEERACAVLKQAHEDAEQLKRDALSKRAQIELEIIDLEEHHSRAHQALHQLLTTHLSMLVGNGRAEAPTPERHDSAPAIHRRPPSPPVENASSPTLKVRAQDIAESLSAGANH